MLAEGSVEELFYPLPTGSGFFYDLTRFIIYRYTLLEIRDL